MIYNLDETGIPLELHPPKAVAHKGQKKSLLLDFVMGTSRWLAKDRDHVTLSPLNYYYSLLYACALHNHDTPPLQKHLHMRTVSTYT